MEEFAATGRRKTAIARVRLRPGKGKWVVNKRSLDEYFGRVSLKDIVNMPFKTVELEGSYDVFVNVKGGGLSGQAGAIQLGIARSLLQVNEDFRKPMRSSGFLTRDPRMVERKKYGQPGARKKFQFSKR